MSFLRACIILLVFTLPCLAQDIYQIPDTGVSPGSPVSIPVLCTTTQRNMQGFTLVLGYDPSRLYIEDVLYGQVAQMAADANLDTDTVDFWALHIDPDDPAQGPNLILGVIFEIGLPYGEAQLPAFPAPTSMVRVVGGVSPVLSVGDDVPLFFRQEGVGVNGPRTPLFNGYTYNDPILGARTQLVQTIDPAITVSSEAFKRGDFNGDGGVGMRDALDCLLWGFVGGPESPCEDAADADDSGDLLPIAEALYVLLWQFSGGQTPPSPGPTTCGTDPTQDTLTCKAPPSC